MRIGLDYRPAMGPVTGIGRYVRGLTRELARFCDLQLYGYFRRGNRPSGRRAPEGATLHARAVPSRLMDLLARLRVVSTERLLGGCDLFHHTNFRLAHVRTPQVIMLHDLAFLRAPWAHTPRATAALTRVARQAVRRCAAVLVPSPATARDCEVLLGVAPDRVFVTPLGVDERFYELGGGGSGGGKPYLLAVGTLEPRKNFERLIRACDGVELRIAGASGWLCEGVVAAARERENVHLEGAVSDERLAELMTGASAVAYPSLLEGFGLPVLEAMAAGKPVLTSDLEPMADVAGDAALLVDPTDDEALADGVQRVLFDDALRARLAAAGPERARRFTWEACARATLNAYDAVLS